MPDVIQQGAAGYQCTLKATPAGEGATQKDIAQAIDVDINTNSGKIDATSRASAGWKNFLPGLKEWSSTVNHLWVPADDGYKALWDSYKNGTLLACQFRDKAGYGFDGSAFVTKMGRAEKLEGALVVPIELQGTGPLAEVAPQA